MVRVDDGRRGLRLIRADAPDGKDQPRSANAEAAARYRARQRGEAVPRRKPGPRAAESRLREENHDLRARVAELDTMLRSARERLESLTRHPSTLSMQRLAEDLLLALTSESAERDTPETQAALRAVAAEIQHRGEHRSSR